jgi:hypothetical protein
MDNKCALCTAEYHLYDVQLYESDERTPTFNLECWDRFKDNQARVMAWSSADADYCLALNRVDSAGSFLQKVAEVTVPLRLSSILGALALCEEELEGPGSVPEKVSRLVSTLQAYLREGAIAPSDPVAAALLSCSQIPPALASLSSLAMDELNILPSDQLLNLIAATTCPELSPALEDFHSSLSQASMRTLIGAANGHCRLASKCGALYSSISAALAPARSSKELWDTLEDRTLPGLGFKIRENAKKLILGDTAAQAIALNLAALTRSRAQTLAKFNKAACHHVTGVPIEYLGDRPEGLKPPVLGPPTMHALVSTSKKFLGLAQEFLLTGEDGDDRHGSRQEYAFRQQALVNKERTFKDEEKMGDRLGTAMNGEHTRQLLSHWKWLFGGLGAPRYLQVANLLSMYNSLVYCGADPSPQSRVLCWLLGNLDWNFFRVLDELSRAKKQNEKKPLVQSNHMHSMAVELPRFHEKSPLPLTKTLEEKLEALQKVSKEAGAKRSDRKSNVVQTMYREEYMRENAILLYGLSAQDSGVHKKQSSLFVKAEFPNLVIHSCAFNLNPIFHKTFSQLLTILTRLRSGASLHLPALYKQAYFDTSPHHSAWMPLQMLLQVWRSDGRVWNGLQLRVSRELWGVCFGRAVQVHVRVVSRCSDRDGLRKRCMAALTVVR